MAKIKCSLLLIHTARFLVSQKKKKYIYPRKKKRKEGGERGGRKNTRSRSRLLEEPCRLPVSYLYLLLKEEEGGR